MKVKPHRPKQELVVTLNAAAVEDRALTPLQPCKNTFGKQDQLRPESSDPAYIEEARMDAITAWDPSDMPLADYECRHGKLPTDNNIICDCWGRDLTADLRDRLRGLSREEAIAALLAA